MGYVRLPEANSTRISSFHKKQQRIRFCVSRFFLGKPEEKKSTSTSPLLDSQLQCQILRAVQAFLEVVEVAKAVEESVACQLANKGLGWDPLPDIESNDFGGDWYPGWGKHPNFQIVSSIAFVLPQADGNS